MAITFIDKRKKITYLFPVLTVLALILVIVVGRGFLPGMKPLVFPEFDIPVEKIEIDFKVFKNPSLVAFRPFETAIYPSPQATNVSLTPVLEWQGVPGAEIYQWEIFGVASGQTENTSSTIEKTLEPSATYVWRVKSCTRDKSVCSAWSGDCQTEKSLGCWRFDTIKAPSLALVSPSPQAKNVSLTPVLEWQGVPDAEIYVWEILDIDSGQTEQTSAAVEKKLKPSATYVWRVKSCTRDMSVCSAWISQTFATSFVLSPPDLVSPFGEAKEGRAEEERAEGERSEETKEIQKIGRENPFISY